MYEYVNVQIKSYHIYIWVCVCVFVLLVKEPWTTDSTSTPFSGSCVKIQKKLIRWCWKWTGIYRGSGRAQSRPCGCIWSSTQVGESCSNIEDGMGLGSFKFGSYLDLAGRQGIDWTNRYQQCNLVLSTKWCIIIAAMSIKTMGWTSVPHGMRSAFRNFCSIAAWFIMEN